MRSRTEAPILRRNLTLNDRSLSRLGRLRVDTDAASDSEVIRQALLYFEQLADDWQVGRSLEVIDTSGAVTKVTRKAVGEIIEADDVPTIKRNIMLPERAAARIEELRQRSEFKSDSELVRAAVIVYDILVSHVMQGARVYTVDDHGHATEQAILVSRAKARPPRLLGFPHQTKRREAPVLVRRLARAAVVG